MTSDTSRTSGASDALPPRDAPRSEHRPVEDDTVQDGSTEPSGSASGATATDRNTGSSGSDTGGSGSGDRSLLRAGELPGRPVVTVGGHDIAQIRDVVYEPSSGEVIGFTLAKRGVFSGKRKERLPTERVVGIGPHAVVIPDEEALVAKDGLRQPADKREIIGARVLTDDGRELGNVSDLIISTRGSSAEVVGYELDPADSFRDSSSHVLLPLPDTLSVSGDNLVVPAAAADYVRDDLAGFGAAVQDFRAQLAGGHQ